MRLFRPTARQLYWLLIVASMSVGYALYFRYMVIEQSTVSLACEGGSQTWLCFTRKVFLAVFQPGLFGYVALGAATVNLIRPSMAALTIALIAGGFGIVLYNVEMSALAAGLMILSLARPAPSAA
ncbi:MAG TPA: hypothetical protein VJL90_10170 [Pseudorhodoplanes sp.]|nr:hypothetical protein [Pseudorhodoplanes sp.]